MCIRDRTVETYQKNLKSLKGFAEGLMKNLETLDAMVSFLHFEPNNLVNNLIPRHSKIYMITWKFLTRFLMSSQYFLTTFACSDNITISALFLFLDKSLWEHLRFRFV